MTDKKLPDPESLAPEIKQIAYHAREMGRLRKLRENLEGFKLPTLHTDPEIDHAYLQKAIDALDESFRPAAQQTADAFEVDGYNHPVWRGAPSLTSQRMKELAVEAREVELKPDASRVRSFHRAIENALKKFGETDVAHVILYHRDLARRKAVRATLMHDRTERALRPLLESVPSMEEISHPLKKVAKSADNLGHDEIYQVHADMPDTWVENRVEELKIASKAAVAAGHSAEEVLDIATAYHAAARKAAIIARPLTRQQRLVLEAKDEVQYGRD